MDLLLNNVLLDDPQSELNGSVVNILVRAGQITSIGTSEIPCDGKIIDLKGVSVSPGWMDIGVQAGEPGYEHREDFVSLAKAASAGGFTAIACLPNVNPVMDNKAAISYLKKNSLGLGVHFFPIGAVSEGANGGDITEMMDMTYHGAVAFSDGEMSIQHSGLMLRALLYCKSFGGLIINQPNDYTLSENGQLNEGVQAVSLGMKGIPALAEELMIQRDISLLDYADSRLHIAYVSTKGGVEMIRAAKSQGLNITASVAGINLLLDDTVVDGVNTNYKVMPPLRTKEDIEALQKGLLDGTIDCIASNHVPREEETKKLEFPYASFGAIGLQTTFSAVCTGLGKQVQAMSWANCLAIHPRKILGIQGVSIQKGQQANMTFFDIEKEWTVKEEDLFSKSKNSPFLGKKMKGKVLGILLGENLMLRL